MLGDTETGGVVTHLTLPFWKDEVGRWERCNISPTGGRQHVGDGMSSNGTTTGDGRRGKGAVVLVGATWRDRRIAQASNGNQKGCCGVVGFAQGQVKGVSGQNLRDTVGPSRDVDSVSEGKPRVRNVCGAKGGFSTDCTANRSHMLTGLHHCESSRKGWLTWEVPCYTSRPLFRVGGKVWERRRVGSNRTRVGVALQVRCTGLRTGPKIAIGCRSFRRFDWVSSARITAGIAEHHDVEGWPPRRQRRTWHDVQRNRGQNPKHHQEFKVPSSLERHGGDCADGFGGPQSDSIGSRRGDPTRPAPPGLPYCPDQHVRSCSGQDLRTTQRCPLLHQSRRSTLTRQDIGASVPTLIEMDRDSGQRPRLQDLWSGKPPHNHCSPKLLLTL